jgi:hypothetical protein
VKGQRTGDWAGREKEGQETEESGTKEREGE